MLRLMYITADPAVARLAQKAGVDRIFVDMERIGKAERQRGMDTVQNACTPEDVAAVRPHVAKGGLLVRVNPVHDASGTEAGTEAEVDAVIEAGADIVMLPYFETAAEARRFIAAVGGRARTALLIETPEAVRVVDEILAVEGVDEVYVGLNDLSLGLGQRFMFEPLADGTVDALAARFKAAGVPFGFGGVASLRGGLVRGGAVVQEHYRLGSSTAILSRSFCDVRFLSDYGLIGEVFDKGVAAIRELEAECGARLKAGDFAWFESNRDAVRRAVAEISERRAEAAGGGCA